VRRWDVFLKGKCFGCGLACVAFAFQKNDASQLVTCIEWVNFHGAAKADTADRREQKMRGSGPSLFSIIASR